MIRIKEINPQAFIGAKTKVALFNLLVEIETQQSIRAAAVAAGEDLFRLLIPFIRYYCKSSRHLL